MSRWQPCSDLNDGRLRSWFLAGVLLRRVNGSHGGIQQLLLGAGCIAGNGMALGHVFYGESMFSRADNASKVGFATLVEHLKAWGFVMIDCQMPTGHLESLGARSISRQAFAGYLSNHLDTPNKADWLPRRA